MNKSKVNLIDIAKKAGVSISTVSLVLNNKNGVGNELSKKINEIALNIWDISKIKKMQKIKE